MQPIYLHITSADCRGDVIEISGDVFHHLARVRRIGVGAPLRCALPDGRLLAAEVAEITATAIRARVTGEEAGGGISPCRITLCQAVLKGEKMDLVVQKATELGASAIVPLLARRSVPHWSPQQAIERAGRWQRIADAAADQCERAIPPRVSPPCEIRELRELPVVTLLLHERDGEPLSALAARHPQLDEVGLLIGPEGGWDDEEAAALRKLDVQPIHLGSRILRAETAAIAAITLVQYLWGDLK